MLARYRGPASAREIDVSLEKNYKPNIQSVQKNGVCFLWCLWLDRKVRTDAGSMHFGG